MLKIELSENDLANLVIGAVIIAVVIGVCAIGIVHAISERPPAPAAVVAEAIIPGIREEIRAALAAERGE